MPKSTLFMAYTQCHAHINAALTPMHSCTTHGSLSLIRIVPLWIHIPHHQPLNPTMANTEEISHEAAGAAERHFTDNHSR